MGGFELGTGTTLCVLMASSALRTAFSKDLMRCGQA
jgi:hypothetical protein